MVTKQILYSEDARKALERGVDLVANTVKLTIGPCGKNIVLERPNGYPLIVNDGVTIAREISVKDKFENSGAMLVKEVCSKTNDMAGDGTTTAAILIQSLVKEGIRHVAAGADPMALRRGINKASAAFTEQLKKLSKEVSSKETIKQIADISSGNEEMFGQVIADAFEKVGKEGIITIEESKNFDTSIEYVEGIQIDRGFLSPYFINNTEKMECVLEDPWVVCVDYSISTIAEILPMMQRLAKQTPKRPVLFIAEDTQGEALACFISNSLQKILLSCVIRAPGRGESLKEYLGDIAVLTGASVISPDTGKSLEKSDLVQYGSAARAIITRDKAVLISNTAQNAQLDERIAALNLRIASTESAQEKQVLEHRLGKLQGGAVIIKIAGVTETELKDKKLRFEDALNATRAALAEGFVPGGGTSLVIVASELQEMKNSLTGDERTGFESVLKALEAPLQQIAENGGFPGAVVIDYVKKSKKGVGYDVKNGAYVDMIEAGIIDPTKVERVAVQHACSIAGMFLTTEALIVSDPEPELKQQQQQPMFM